MSRPAQGTYPPYFERYIGRVNGDAPLEVLENYSTSTLRFYQELPVHLEDHAYAPEKWTLKEVVQHVVDTERIMSYRLLRIARNDATPLPGFEENDYAHEAAQLKRSFASIKEEFTAVRHATDLLIRSLTPAQFAYMGNTNGHPVSAGALVYIIYGHLIHHKMVIEERYLGGI